MPSLLLILEFCLPAGEPSFNAQRIFMSKLVASSRASTLGVMRFSFPAFSQGSSVVEQGTHKPLVGSSTLPPGTPLLLGLGNIWLQVFLTAAHRRHKAHSAVFGHCTGPAFLMDIAPSGKSQHRAGFHIPLRGKE